MGDLEARKHYLVCLICLMTLLWSGSTRKTEISNHKIPNDQMTCKDDPMLNGTRCNHRFECQDCSDELNCTENPHFSRIFMCENGSCIFLGKCTDELNCVAFCNGVHDCQPGDQSDEPKIGFGFRCEPHRCIIPPEYIRRWKGVTDHASLIDHAICPKGDDILQAEDICYSEGSSYLNLGKCHQCTDGTIISRNQLCDGKMDCEDLSDECLCVKKSNESVPCLTNETDVQCETIESVCNGTVRCSRIGQDQESCMPSTTKSNCLSGLGMEVTYCDGRPECEDMQDECNENCTNIPGFCKYENEIYFIHAAYPESACVAGTKFCDGKQDCADALDEKHCPHRISCNPNETISYWYDNETEGCDFIVHCNDTWADEQNCPHHFYCNKHQKHFATPGQILDGLNNCPDAEDECDADLTSHGQYMIRYDILKVLMWIMALVALVGNSVVIVNSARDLRATYRRGATAAVTGRVGACNKTLVLNLALADFLMGVYLLILNIKAVEYDGSYCKYSSEWRSSSLCSGLGAIAVLSSQTSVLIMVMMTTYRLYSVRMPFRADKLKVRYLVGLVIVGWILPAIVAFYPLMSHDKAFAMLMNTHIPFFEKAMVEKPEFEKVVREAWKFNSSSPEFGSSNWYNLMDKFCKMYSEVCDSLEDGSLVRKWFGYYSADSVCLPRLFPHVGDSGWEYTVGVITFDFAAFIYILAAYLMMYSFTVTGSSESGNGTISFRGSSFSSVDELRSREDRVIWQRISRLLFTDFLCWIPICVTCLVSLLSDAQIPTELYQFSAVLFLPVNSALNPVLYSNVINRLFDRFCPQWLRLDLGGYAGLCKWLRKNGTHTPPDDIRLNYVRAASASDETKHSGDLLAVASCTDTRSITLSETDKTRAGAGPDNRCVFTPRKRSECADESVFLSDMPPISEKSEQRNGIARSISKFGRFFSERNQREAPPVRRHRPKSQSTTSTSTFFTTLNQND